MTFPAAGQRKIDLRDLFCHHPKGEDIASIWTKPETAVLFGDYWSVLAGAEEIFKVLGGKGRCHVIVSRARGEPFTRQVADAFDKLLLITLKVELRVKAVVGVSSYHGQFGKRLDSE